MFIMVGLRRRRDRNHCDGCSAGNSSADQRADEDPGIRTGLMGMLFLLRNFPKEVC